MNVLKNREEIKAYMASVWNDRRVSQKSIQEKFGISKCTFFRLKKEAGLPNKPIRQTQDIVGKRFGRLVVLERCSDDSKYVMAKCDCGTVYRYRYSCLIQGYTKSCGCYRRDANKARFAKLRELNGK